MCDGFDRVPGARSTKPGRLVRPDGQPLAPPSCRSSRSNVRPAASTCKPRCNSAVDALLLQVMVWTAQSMTIVQRRHVCEVVAYTSVRTGWSQAREVAKTKV